MTLENELFDGSEVRLYEDFLAELANTLKFRLLNHSSCAVTLCP